MAGHGVPLQNQAPNVRPLAAAMTVGAEDAVASCVLNVLGSSYTAHDCMCQLFGTKSEPAQFARELAGRIINSGSSSDGSSGSGSSSGDGSSSSCGSSSGDGSGSGGSSVGAGSGSGQDSSGSTQPQTVRAATPKQLLQEAVLVMEAVVGCSRECHAYSTANTVAKELLSSLKDAAAKVQPQPKTSSKSKKGTSSARGAITSTSSNTSTLLAAVHPTAIFMPVLLSACEQVCDEAEARLRQLVAEAREALMEDENGGGSSPSPSSSSAGSSGTRSETLRMMQAALREVLSCGADDPSTSHTHKAMPAALQGLDPDLKSLWAIVEQGAAEVAADVAAGDGSPAAGVEEVQRRMLELLAKAKSDATTLGLTATVPTAAPPQPASEPAPAPASAPPVPSTSAAAAPAP